MAKKAVQTVKSKETHKKTPAKKSSGLTAQSATQVSSKELIIQKMDRVLDNKATLGQQPLLTKQEVIAILESVI